MTIRTLLVATMTALFIAAGSASPTLAQPEDSPALSTEKVSWTEHFGKQIRALLETEDPERQQNAIQHVLLYANRSDVDIDFEAAVPALFEIYENAEDDGLRLMALTALNAIGGEPVMARLAERVSYEKSNRVREHTLRILMVHRLSRDRTEM